MNTTITIEERRDGSGTYANVDDDAEVILVRDGAISRDSSHPRYLIDGRDILGMTTLREYVAGDYGAGWPASDDEINVAVACTSEEIDGHEVLIPFRTL